MMTLFNSSYKAIPQVGVSAGSGFCVMVSLDPTAFSLERWCHRYYIIIDVDTTEYSSEIIRETDDQPGSMNAV